AAALSVVEGLPAEGDGCLDDPGVVAEVLQTSQRLFGRSPRPLERMGGGERPQIFARRQRRALREGRLATHLCGGHRQLGGLRARAEVVLLELRLAQLEEG